MLSNFSDDPLFHDDASLCSILHQRQASRTKGDKENERSRESRSRNSSLVPRSGCPFALILVFLAARVLPRPFGARGAPGDDDAAATILSLAFLSPRLSLNQLITDLAAE